MTISAFEKRCDRKIYLIETDAMVFRHRDQIDLGVETTMSAESFLQLLEYRQFLRDLPEQEDWENLQVPSFQEYTE